MVKRLGWIDAMRGFSMILVILGHVNIMMGYKGYETFLTFFFITFRMPLFFFVSGFLSFRTIEWWNAYRVGDILNRKIRAQIIGTLIFFSIYQLTLGNGHIDFSNGFSGYWFTIVLFQMYITYIIFSILSKTINHDITIPCIIITSVISLLILVFFRGHGFYWNLLSWENFTKYYQFFALGVISAKYKILFFRFQGEAIYKTIIIVVWIISLILCCNDVFKASFPFLYRIIHDIIVRYCGLLTVVMMFFHYSKKIDYTKGGKVLQFVGKRTLDIYMLHFFFLPKITFIKGYLSLGENMMVIQFAIATSITLIITAICLGVSNILRQSPYIASWLFGARLSKIGS